MGDAVVDLHCIYILATALGVCGCFTIGKSLMDTKTPVLAIINCLISLLLLLIYFDLSRAAVYG